MFKFFIPLLFCTLLFGESLFSMGGKKMYQSMTQTVKAGTEMVRSTMYVEPVTNETPPELVKKEDILDAKEREKYLKMQFVSKEEILEVQTVDKEEIAVDIETLEFFDSLNAYETKPIDIE